jgi:predicted dehydrogenase
MAGTIRFGILGTGHMAQTMAHCLRGMDGVAVAGFASRDPTRARAIGAAYGAPSSYESLDAMLVDPTIGAIYVVNDSALHADAAIKALEAGKPVLCEKPCGLDAGQARAIEDAATRTGTLFIEAIATPFLPAVATAIDAGTSGRLGTLLHLGASFGYPTTATSHPGCYAAQGGGVLLDRAIYLVTLALITLGPVAGVKGVVRRNADGIDVEASLILDHENGAVSMLDASLLTQLDNRLNLAGTQGSTTVEAPLLAAERVSLTLHGEIGRGPPPGGGLAARLKQAGPLRRLKAILQAARTPHLSYGHSLYAAEIAHFRDLIRAGASESPVLPPHRSVEALAIIDVARALPG